VGNLKTEFLIIGGGIVGLTLARELLRQGATDILIIDKEPKLGMHASGRNSGVLHAGIYYQKDTLKAKFCQMGSRLMKDYCRENGLPLHETGKVIVTRNEAEMPGLGQLFIRAQANGARVSLIDKQELAEIEPSAFTMDKAIYSPETAMVDPKQVISCLQKELQAKGIRVLTACAFKGLKNKTTALTEQGAIEFKQCINAAGSYADKVAHSFGVGLEYKMLPFKGTYRQLVDGSNVDIRGNIYPVPDLRNPFLGVHFTRNVHGMVTVGPTAIPCFGRENYQGLAGINRELFSILGGSAQLLIRNPGFRRVAMTEPRKYLTRYLYNDASKLVKGLKYSDLKPTSKVGIRPQLIHWPTKKLVMDFLVERTENSLHVLNAISPAFTCSMAVSKQLVESLSSRKESLCH
jgi:(S)-2-hydroxyglutarate dehydrogenase